MGTSTTTFSFAAVTLAVRVEASANELRVVSALDADGIADPPPAFSTASLTSDPCITAETAAADVIMASGVDAVSMSVFKTEAAPEDTFATAVIASELGASAPAMVPAALASNTELSARVLTVSSDARSNVARSRLRLPETCPVTSLILEATAPTTNLSAAAASPPQPFVSSDVSVDIRFVTSVVATRSSLPCVPATNAAIGSVVVMSIATGIFKAALIRASESALFILSATVVSALTTRPVPGLTPFAASVSNPGAMPVNASTHDSDPATDVDVATRTSAVFSVGRMNSPYLSVVYRASPASSLPLPLESR